MRNFGKNRLTAALLMLCLLVNFSSPAEAAPWPFAAPASQISPTNAKLIESAKQSRSSYVVPNEFTPWRMRVVTRVAPAGALVSVGSERGFISAGLNPQITELILIDVDPQIVLFNRTNAALLAASEDFADYKFLRRQASVEEVLARLHQKAEGKEISEKQLETFLGHVRSGRKGFESRVVMYLEDEAAFLRLQAMAKGGLIQSYLADFSNDRDMKAILQKVRSPQIALVDLSNAWWSNYAGLGGLATAMKQLSPKLAPTSLMLLTQAMGSSRFEYFGVTWAYAHENWREVVATLAKSADDPSSPVHFDDKILGTVNFKPRAETHALSCADLFR